MGSPLSELSCLPGLFTLLNGNVKDAQGELLEVLTQLGGTTSPGFVTFGTSPGFVTFGTLSLVSIGTEPHRAVPLPLEMWTN